MPKIAGIIYRKGVQRCVDVPKAALPRALRNATRPPVIVTLGGLVFESTLLPRDAQHFQLVVPMAVLRKLRRDRDDTIEFALRADAQREAPAVPDELVTALRVNPRARRVFEAQTIAMRRQMVRFIDSARAESTRLARAEKLVSMLLSWKTKG